MILKDRMARFKIEEIKELKLELKFEELILERSRLGCEMNNILVSKSYFNQKPNSVCYHAQTFISLCTRYINLKNHCVFTFPTDFSRLYENKPNY